MVEIFQFGTELLDAEGRAYRALLYGDFHGDAGWTGHFAFVPRDGAQALWAAADTQHATAHDLAYWAFALSTSHLESALRRAKPHLTWANPPRPGAPEVPRDVDAAASGWA